MIKSLKVGFEQKLSHYAPESWVPTPEGLVAPGINVRYGTGYFV